MGKPHGNPPTLISIKLAQKAYKYQYHSKSLYSKLGDISVSLLNKLKEMIKTSGHQRTT